MSANIIVSKDDIGAEAFTVANLMGLLNEQGQLLTSWFSNPAIQLQAAPGRAKALIETLQTFLGPEATTNAPVFPGAQWYQLQNPSSGEATGFYIVTPPASDAGGLVGLGIQHAITVGNLTIDFYAFAPVFKINNGSSPDFVLINTTPGKVSPIRIGLDAVSTAILDAGDAGTFTDFTVEADISLDGKASDLFGLTLGFSGGTMTSSDVYHTLTDFINASTTADRMGTLIVQGMSYWLNLYIGSSGHTVGDVLVNANLMGTGTSGKFTYYQYDATALKKIKTDPLGAAEDILFAVLQALADNEKPLIPLPFLDPKTGTEEGASQDESGDNSNAKAKEGDDGEDAGDDSDAPVAGVWVAFNAADEKGGNNHGSYGLRLMIPDIPIKLGGGETSPTLHLRLGSWFTGEDSDENGWVNAIVKGDTPLKPGLSVFFLNYDGTNISFAPTFELTSAGFDIVGAKDTPLFNVGGVTMQGVELRAYVNQNASWQFGFGARVDEVGIPLGSSFTGGMSSGGGNAVVKSLVASGDNASGSTGGDAATGKTDAINPQFSLEAAYVSGTVGADENWFVELLPPNGASGDIVWFPISRKFGPINCKKVGLGWNQANLLLDVVLDGGVSLAGLSADLIELSVGIPLSDPTSISSYHLGLKGLDVAYSGGGVEIQGGFLQSGTGDEIEYDGLASIKVGTLGIGALGSYAALPGGGTSLFIFAFLDAPLGGPAAFFVTGLAAGFGYNRSLIAPAFDKVSDFPLLKGMQDPSALGLKPGEPPDLSSVLTTLKDSVPVTRGEYWLAAGVKFTSFELIKSNVLLAVEFGNEFEIMILGTSVLRLPQQGSVTMAYAELEIAIIIEPDAGVVEASAVLSPNSYVLDPACHLTGGFAFYLWFGPNEHAGDFVLTIGGYHPAFKKPAWYPDVPRLGFNWKISDSIEITGGAYFALTPSCVMAGGALKLLFSSGCIKAWFEAHADMLISWKPFFYDISIGVTIGVSVKIDFLFIKGTITVEVGADVEIWGPPTGGKADVHLWVVSFTIRFGPDKSAVKTLTDWEGFKQLLPGGSDTDSSKKQVMLAAGHTTRGAMEAEATASNTSDPTVCNISFASGVTSTVTNEQNEKVWIVNPAEFAFNVGTTTPVTDATLNTKTVNLNTPSDYYVGARPMGVSNLQTPLTITVTGDQDADWEYDVLKSDVPEAVWGRALPPGATPPAAATLLLDRVTGLNNIVPEPHTPQGPPVIDMETAFTDVPVTQYPELLPFAHTPVPQGAVPQQGVDSFAQLKQVMSPAVSAERSALFAAFGLLGVYAGTDGSLATMAGDPYFAYCDAPMTGSPLPA